MTDAPAAHEPEPVNRDLVVEYFGAAFDRVERFREMLAGEGVTRGLIGPREAPRLWERHLLNSASVAAFLPEQGSVIDVGSGAGLPGVVLAAMRPDLTVTLVEPMLRRVTWLEEVVETLELAGSVSVVRARAEELHGTLLADAVTARAVAPLDRLAGWTLPLVRQGGALLALKGSQAAVEAADAAPALSALGGGPAEVLDAPTIPGFDSTVVVRVLRERMVPPAPQGKRGRR